jgi:hypothetical protein
MKERPGVEVRQFPEKRWAVICPFRMAFHLGNGTGFKAFTGEGAWPLARIPEGRRNAPGLKVMV